MNTRSLSLTLSKEMAAGISRRAFSLIELLCVVCVMTLLAVLSGPALRALQNAGAVNKAIEELSGTCAVARLYAMTHHTYVRVGIAQVAAGGLRRVPSTIVIMLYSADGTLANDDATGMADNSKWRLINKALVLNNICVYDSLNASTPDTVDDAKPSATDIASFTRKVGDLGTCTFSAIIQFNAVGEARVSRSEPSRYIKLGMDQPRQASTPDIRRDENPFILRLSGINGTVNILRKENLN